jgi:TRAP transporter TAXI family solute receptor
MLATAGLKESDVKAVTIANVGEGAKMLTEGNVDATFTAIGIPIVKQAHSTIQGGIAYVDLGAGDTSEKTISQFAPGIYADKVAPVAAMPEITAPITVAAFDVFLVTSAAMSEAEAAALVKALAENFAELQKDFAALRTGDPAKFSAPTNTAPFHPGAAAHFRATGKWSAANDARDKAMK